MLPIVIKPQKTRIGLAGAGDGLVRRSAVLVAAGVEPVRVAPGEALDGLSVLFVAGLGEAASESLAADARAKGILVNVEDMPELCDFNVPAILRRGDLMFAISTNGRAPGLASRLREWLEERFGAEWEARLVELGSARDRLRAAGARARDIAANTRHIIAEKGWLR